MVVLGGWVFSYERGTPVGFSWGTTGNLASGAQNLLFFWHQQAPGTSGGILRVSEEACNKERHTCKPPCWDFFHKKVRCSAMAASNINSKGPKKIGIGHEVRRTPDQSADPSKSSGRVRGCYFYVGLSPASWKNDACSKRDALAAEREFLIHNLLVRILFIIVMIRWTGLAPWEFESPFPSSQPCPVACSHFSSCLRARRRPRSSTPGGQAAIRTSRH